MKTTFSTLFKRDLLEAEERYTIISPKLGDDFHERVKEAVRTIIARAGCDHIGPHGFPCRKCRPFPYLIYYIIENDSLYILGIIQERRHPNSLRDALKKES